MFIEDQLLFNSAQVCRMDNLRLANVHCQYIISESSTLAMNKTRNLELPLLKQAAPLLQRKSLLVEPHMFIDIATSTALEGA